MRVSILILAAAALASCKSPPHHDTLHFGKGADPRSYADISGMTGTQSGRASMADYSVSNWYHTMPNNVVWTNITGCNCGDSTRTTVPSTMAATITSDTNEDRLPLLPWNLLTQSFGGTVSLIRDLTEHECKMAKSKIKPEVFIPESVAGTGNTANTIITFTSSGDIRLAECFQ